MRFEVGWMQPDFKKQHYFIASQITIFYAKKGVVCRIINYCCPYFKRDLKE